VGYRFAAEPFPGDGEAVEPVRAVTSSREDFAAVR
jgi:hypothetical protein